MDMDQACPKCKTTLYRNPQMKLLVNVCGHNLCESCVELLFAKGETSTLASIFALTYRLGSGSCPECGIPLRRTNFRFQLFEDASIDKEVDIRRRLLRDFNKKEEDFVTLREYNDYLEMVEDLIYNLSNNVDILETNKRIAAYKEQNKAFISKNRHRVTNEELELEGLLAEENRAAEERRMQAREEVEMEKKLKEESKEKMLDDLMFSDADARAIVSQHREQVATRRKAAVAKFSTGQEIGSSAHLDQVAEVGQAYFYVRPAYDTNGPLPAVGGLKPFLRHVREPEESELAAGYSSSVPCSRALTEAMCGLFFGVQ